MQEHNSFPKVACIQRPTATPAKAQDALPNKRLIHPAFLAGLECPEPSLTDSAFPGAIIAMVGKILPTAKLALSPSIRLDISCSLALSLALTVRMPRHQYQR
jgi:hypothetical protein